MKAFWRYVTAGVGFAMLVTIVLLVTGWGSAAASALLNVVVTNTAGNPVPVQETGTVPVHEQGTSNVNVTNTSLPVTPTGTVPVHEQGTSNVNVTNATVPTHEQGTADVNVTNSSLPVSVQGTPSVAQSGTWNVGITGTPTVKSGDTATVIDEGDSVSVPAGQGDVIGQTVSRDVSAYREVTLYWDATGPPLSDLHFYGETSDGTSTFVFDQWTPGDVSGSRTWVPAPATFDVEFANQGGSTATLDFVLVGRNN